MLELREVCELFSLLDSCLEVGLDPDGWRQVLAVGLADLFGCVVAQSGEFRNIYDDEAEVLHFIDYGWESDEQKAHFVAYQVEGAHRLDPARTILKARRGHLVATSTGALTDFEAYTQSEVYRRYMAPAGLGDNLISITQIPNSDGTRWNMISCMRRAGEPLFRASERRLMRLLAILLRPLIGERLADSTSPLMRLTPRQHQTLRLLLDGLSEAKASAAMGISQQTLHKSVTELYRLFGISSRAQLQAHFAGRGRLTTERERVHDPLRGRVRREGAPMARPWHKASTFRALLPRGKRDR